MAKKLLESVQWVLMVVVNIVNVVDVVAIRTFFNRKLLLHIQQLQMKKRRRIFLNFNFAHK